MSIDDNFNNTKYTGFILIHPVLLRPTLLDVYQIAILIHIVIITKDIQTVKNTCIKKICKSWVNKYWQWLFAGSGKIAIKIGICYFAGR